ncbi:unnamed protein product [Polarella glacialis]|uniref:Methyltransferase FkbM domain-containing protein n=1 Tax=Polarella glacialis TaxID=89957 RepID=A0A813GDC9_POLGL|nr:unnamed protein product [Polarella glacialis]
MAQGLFRWHVCLWAWTLGAGSSAEGNDYVICPPPNIQCAADIRRSESETWTLRASVDKALSQRTFELLVIYDWMQRNDDVGRQKVARAMEIMEASRQQLCAVTFVDCDEDLPGRAAQAILRLQQSADDEAFDQAASVSYQACTWKDHGTVPLHQWLQVCSVALWGWADAEYRGAIKPLIPDDEGVMSEASSSRSNAKKVGVGQGYRSMAYPASFSPGGICSDSVWQSKDTWPVFGGEGFGEMSWVDVVNQRTRHLSTISLLELLENGAHFEARHPTGLSRVAINLGANDGACRVGHGLDPANCLFILGFGGVLFEANRSLESAIEFHLGDRRPNVQFVMEAAFEGSVSQRLEEALAKRPGPRVARDEIDLIKIDVDGPDCHLARALANGGWKPKVWHVEVNPLFPPGIVVWPKGAGLGDSMAASDAKQRDLSSAFSRRSDIEDIGSEQQEMVGCSLQALQDLLGDEFVLVHVEFENAVLVRRDLAHALEPWLSSRSDVQKWRDGYFCHALARVRLPHDDDKDSLFLHYDFRPWGDPGLSDLDRQAAVEGFLRHFVKAETYGQIEPPIHMSTPAPWTLPFSSGSGQMQDMDCLGGSWASVLQWPLILTNTERILTVWSERDGDLEELLMAYVEGVADVLNIDRAWPIFKTVASAQCPLGGLAVATILQWRCKSGNWQGNKLTPATDGLFTAMRRQLPLVGELDHADFFSESPQRSSYVAPLGCEHVLERYIQASLRKLDLRTSLRSRWPIFELLSSLHTESKTWPRGYP